MNNLCIKYNDFISEKVYLSKLGMFSYSLVHDHMSNSIRMSVIDDNENEYLMDIQIDGNYDNKDINNEKFKFDTFRIFYPDNIGSIMNEDIFKNLCDKILKIINKNRLGYKFKIDEYKKPKYGLKSFIIIKVNLPLNYKELERIVSSTKAINNMVKKNGDLNQFTF